MQLVLYVFILLFIWFDKVQIKNNGFSIFVPFSSGSLEFL